MGPAILQTRKAWATTSPSVPQLPPWLLPSCLRLRRGRHCRRNQVDRQMRRLWQSRGAVQQVLGDSSGRLTLLAALHSVAPTWGWGQSQAAQPPVRDPVTAQAQ